jgi:hypothetical protein
MENNIKSIIDIIDNNLADKSKIKEKVMEIVKDNQTSDGINLLIHKIITKKIANLGEIYEWYNKKEEKLIEQGKLTNDEIIELKQEIKKGLRFHPQKNKIGKDIETAKAEDDFNFKDDSNNTIVFLLGEPTTGKSLMLGGLLFEALNLGRLLFIKDHPGTDYAWRLKEAIENGVTFTDATTKDYSQFIPCKLKDNDGKWHIITFIEMSGEAFNLFLVKKDIPSEIAFMFRDNAHLVTLFMFDPTEELNKKQNDNSQVQKMSSMLKALEKGNKMQNIICADIVITKWDLVKDKFDNVIVCYKKKFNQIHATIEDYGKNQFFFRTYLHPFSLGTFDKDNSVIEIYDNSYSLKTIQWLCDVTSPITTNNKPWWKFWWHI